MEPSNSPDPDMPKKSQAATPIPEGTSDWAKTTLSSLFSKIDELSDNLSTSINFAVSTAEEAQKASLINTNKITDVQNQLDKTNNNYLALQADDRFLRDKINCLETYSRRDNLLFHGIEEKSIKTDRDCAAVVRRVLNTIVPDAVNHIYIIRCHRKGRYVPGQTRPIIYKFCPEDREHIWDNKTALNGSNFFIAKDFPFDVEQSQKILYPIFFKARSLSVFKSKVYLRGDRFFLLGIICLQLQISLPCHQR